MKGWIFIFNLCLKVCICLAIPPMTLMGNSLNSNYSSNGSMALVSDVQAENTLDSDTSKGSRIVNGSLATQETAPWQVFVSTVYVEDGATWIGSCGGTLISTRVVVTAAHCIYMNNLLSVTVKLGSLDRNSQSMKEYSVDKFYYHTQYNSNYGIGSISGTILVNVNNDNDIALLVLKDEVAFTSYIQPATLPPDDKSLEYSAEIARVSGWGTTSFKGNPSNELRYADVRVQERSDCKELYDNIFISEGVFVQHNYTDNMICADYHSDACQGDGGGPLVLITPTANTLIGIVSWGQECGKYYGVYVKVTNYVQWIKDRAAEGGAPLNNTVNIQFSEWLILAMFFNYLVTLLRY